MRVGTVVANRLNCTLGKFRWVGRIGLREKSSLGTQVMTRLVYQFG